MLTRMDSMMAKGAGKVKAITAALQGRTGIFRTLSEQHAEVKVLIERLQKHPDRKAELWPEIRRELLSHERGEIAELYPVLREYPRTVALAEHHDQEAAAMEKLIETIDRAGGAWPPIFDELVGKVLEHVREEEQEIFPAAQQAMGDERAKELDGRFLAVKKELASVV